MLACACPVTWAQAKLFRRSLPCILFFPFDNLGKMLQNVWISSGMAQMLENGTQIIQRTSIVSLLEPLCGPLESSIDEVGCLMLSVVSRHAPLWRQAAS